jgi:hypothetical protein
MICEHCGQPITDDQDRVSIYCVHPAVLLHGECYDQIIPKFGGNHYWLAASYLADRKPNLDAMLRLPAVKTLVTV